MLSYLPGARRKAMEIATAKTALPQLLTISTAAADAGKGREIASIAANLGDIVQVKDWEKGMTTQPGDMVYNPAKTYIYLYTGQEPMTHSNQTFYPGASGVYYWAIIPNLHEGFKVYPDVSGIIVAVKKDEIWWNPGKTQKYKWTSEDNNSCSWYPGQTGVHNWAAV